MVSERGLVVLRCNGIIERTRDRGAGVGTRGAGVSAQIARGS
jgi:hypothetical protein